MRSIVRQFTLVSSLLLAGCRPSASTHEDVLVDLANGPVNAFRTDVAFGAVVDGLGKGRVDQVYSRFNIRQLKRAGLRPIVYNLRTELGIEAWHWSQEGTWSDPRHHRGYWTGSDNPRRRVLTGWGYTLPRRGDSIDQANDDGFSRIDDGDLKTFWKSNPYLDQTYTHKPSRPQWVIVSFPSRRDISAARIHWARPFARGYAVQHWTGADEYDDRGRWVDFPRGRVENGTGSPAPLVLADKPVRTQYVRILLRQSSLTPLHRSSDRRDALGYAIHEIELGNLDPAGHFHDEIKHLASGSDQTTIYVSSTDPWHRATDRDSGVEQPGFDRIFATGLNNGLPLLLTVGPLYDTPENTAAEMRFLRRRGYPVDRVEIGLEPDGQNISAEDFADLFVQTADAVRKVEPGAVLAGPGLQDAISDTWLDESADHSWTHRFLAALRAQGRLRDLQEFTFEHYPYDVPCGGLSQKLVAADSKLDEGISRLKADGVPTTIPWSIIEYGFSAFSGESAVDLPAGLFNADLVANFLSHGGHAGYLLGYGPEELFDPENECAGYGELMLFGQDANGRAAWTTPAFWSSVLLAKEWAEPGNGQNVLYRAVVNRRAGEQPWVVAYPVVRPDGRVAVLLINRDPHEARQVKLGLREQPGSGTADFQGPFDVVQYSPQQYTWQAAGPAGHPARDLPPARYRSAAGELHLPPFSISVVRMVNPSIALSKAANSQLALLGK